VFVGIFLLTDSVVWMCVAVLGLGAASLQYNEMHLLPEPLFSVPTDGVHVMHIEATQHGRIFLAGKDGCLYELAYQVCVARIELRQLAWDGDICLIKSLGLLLVSAAECFALMFRCCCYYVHLY